MASCEISLIFSISEEQAFAVITVIITQNTMLYNDEKHYQKNIKDGLVSSVEAFSLVCL